MLPVPKVFPAELEKINGFNYHFHNEKGILILFPLSLSLVVQVDLVAK
jgi:hypothetical protein